MPQTKQKLLTHDFFLPLTKNSSHGFFLEVFSSTATFSYIHEFYQVQQYPLPYLVDKSVIH